MKKILFNNKYGLTKAVMSGCKTQTRRPVPQRILDMIPSYREEYFENTLDAISIEDAIYNLTHGEQRAKMPFRIGEEVAIAQSYSSIFHDDETREFDRNAPGWNNKMFVRAELMPHRIRITGMHIEKLQDISEDDCLKEGIVKYDCVEYDCFGFRDGNIRSMNGMYIGWKTAKEAFSVLIDKVSGKGTWESNPWVFVYDFELMT